MKPVLAVRGNFVVFKLASISRMLFALMIMLACSGVVFAQPRTISGKVSSEDGSPVGNALITIKGSNTRTTTKPDGSYSFMFTRNAGTMVISCAGCVDEEAHIDPETKTLNISIKKVPGAIASTPATKTDTSKKTVTVPPTSSPPTAATTTPVTSQPTAKADTQNKIKPVLPPQPAVTTVTSKPTASQPTIKKDTQASRPVSPKVTPAPVTTKPITSPPTAKADTQNKIKPVSPQPAVTAVAPKPTASQPTIKKDTPGTTRSVSPQPSVTVVTPKPTTSQPAIRKDTQSTTRPVSPPAVVAPVTTKPTTSQPTAKADTQNKKPVSPQPTITTAPKPQTATPTTKSETAKPVTGQPDLKAGAPTTAKPVANAPVVKSNAPKPATSQPSSGSGNAGIATSSPAMQSNTQTNRPAPTTQMPVKDTTKPPIPPVASLVLDTAVITSATTSLLLDTAEVVFEESEIIPDQVVIPYGSVRKRSLTASVGQLGAEDISDRPLTNVTTVIEGQIPGVLTTSVTGHPGAGLNMRVRGFGTINATAEPLLVVDGIPYVGNSSNINPLDVENITVLKDAAATALYGARAGNGVVMITTKKGRRGRNGFSARITQGFTDRGLPEYDRLDASQYYPVMWEAYRNSLLFPPSGIGISLDSANKVASGLTTRPGIQSLLAYNPYNVANNAIVGTDGKLNPAAQLIYGDDLDWTKELFRKGARSDYFIDFNGGGETSDYLFSLGYVKENGYILNSDIKRYTARVNVNAQPAEWLKVGLNISANYSESNLAQDTGSTSQANPFYFTRNMGPIYPVYAHNMTTGEYLIDPATGQKFYDLGNMGGAQGVPNRTLGAFAGRHALAETTLDEESILTTSISGRTYQEITFLKNFRFTNNLSADYQIQDYTSFDNPMVGDGAPLGQSRKVNASTSAFVASQLLGYGNTMDVHRFDGFIGHESFNQKNTNLNGFRQGQTISGSSELDNFSTLTSSTSFVNRLKIESYFSRLNYEFDERYSASASIRRDGVSIFSPDARWGTFWSLSAGWNLSNEEFLANFPWINLLRLRGSYGVTGVSDGTGLPTSFGFYAYQGLYDYANNANEPGIAQSQTQTLNNLALKWETNSQLNVGVDFTVLGNRLNGSVDYFRRSSSDLIFAIPQPLSSGVLTVIQNAASVKNSGVELHLNGDVMRTKLFTWNMTLNISTLNNKITEMPGTVPEFVAGTKRYAEGKSVFEFWLPAYYGVDSADGTALYKAANRTTSANRRIKTNKSGGSDTLTTLASNALFEYYGTSIPDFYGSIGQSLTYKGFTLTGLFTFQIGGKTYDANYQSLMSSGTYGSALSSDIDQRWKARGDNTSIPRVDAGRTTDFDASSSRWLIDASYLNIRMVSLAYNLPLTFISRWNLSTARFFVTGENLGFFSKRKGLNNQQDFGGVTSNAYPPATIISVGITINR